MAPAHMDYLTEVDYTHKKFNTAYTHKKFGKRVAGKQLGGSPLVNASGTATAAPLFRPYALSENTQRQRRLETTVQQQQQPQLPPTPPNTPPQQQQQHQQPQHQQPQHQQQQQLYSPTVLPTSPPSQSFAPALNHQAYAYMLQKQRAVLQMRQLLSLNPDANTWPAEWRNALYALLQR